MGRHHLLSMMVIAVGTVLMDEKQATSNYLSPTPFYESQFPPYYHGPIIGYSNYEPAFPSYYPFDKNSATYYYYSSPFNPFQQQFPFIFYQPDFGTYQNNFDFYPLSAAPPINEEAFESDFLRAWSRRACPPARTLNPCNCFSKRIPFIVPMSTIVCPAGTSSATTKAIFSNIRAGFNINSVTLTLPQGATVADYIPTIFTMKYPATAINVVYPNPPSCKLSNALLLPCTCEPTKEGTIDTITCPAGTTLAQIKTAFNNIPVNTNLGNVVLNIPDGPVVFPANLLGNNTANTIKLIGTFALSKLAIDSEAFTASSGTCTSFTIQQFDVGNLDYAFLKEFKVLTEVSLTKCANTPNDQNPPKNFRQTMNPVKTISFLVDGFTYNSKCLAPALLNPCKCTIPEGDKVVTVSCPPGSSMLEIMTAFTYFTVPYPRQCNIGNVIVNLPAASETILPPSFLGISSDIQTIKLIGPTTKELSKLKITPYAFTSSITYTGTVLELAIENFDLINVDYEFLLTLNYLTTIKISKCTNAPSKNQPPKNLPTDLPNLKSIFVDGINIFTPNLF